MNVYDSARMADVLAPLGYECVDAPEGADLVILNTCHIREKASEKVFSELGRLRAQQQSRGPEDRGRAVIAVAGCVAQAEGETLMQRAPQVDLVVGPQSLHRLPALLAGLEQEQHASTDALPLDALPLDGVERVGKGGNRTRPGLMALEFRPEEKFDSLPAPRLEGPTAFVSIQEGCDKFCSFCVVPYTRGEEVSRPAAAVLAEVQSLVARGAKEVTLLGQNVNAYHGDGPDGRPWSLARLLKALAEIEGLERLRYTTSHPVDMSADLILAHGAIPQLMPFLHLPVQSGSDSILKAMNRRHTVDEYRRIVEHLYKVRPDMALASDFIVGHPGESDADFDATMALVEEVGFAQAYSFKYSPRPGTPAAEQKPVPEAVASARLTALQALLEAKQRAFNARTVGSLQPVLFDRPGRLPGQVLGRSPYNQAVHLDDGRAHQGRLVAVRILASGSHSLRGGLPGSGSGSGEGTTRETESDHHQTDQQTDHQTDQQAEAGRMAQPMAQAVPQVIESDRHSDRYTGRDGDSRHASDRAIP